MPKTKAKNTKQDTANIIRRKDLYWVFGILIVTLIIYFPVTKFGFVWDDTPNIIDNPLIKDFDSNKLKLFFTQKFEGLYQPIILISWSIDNALGKGNAGAFHFSNLLIHLFNIAALFILIKQLFKRLDIAILVTVIFALHPLNVESVAWISEKKNTLFTLFYFLSLSSYIKYYNDSKTKYYWLSLILFVISLISKAQAVVLPLSLFAIDYLYKRNLLNRKVILEKVPFFVLSVIIGLSTLSSAENNFETQGFNLIQRLILSGSGLFHYIIKTFIPANLSAYHPYPINSEGSLPAAHVMAFLATTLFFIYSIYHILKKDRFIGFGILFFFINIALLIQLIPNTSSFMAERYAYISIIGIAIILAGIYLALTERNKKYEKGLKVLFIVLCIPMIIGTSQRIKVWENEHTLWSDVVVKYPENPYALVNLGIAKVNKKDYKGALADYTKAIKVNPKYDKAYNNRGNLYNNIGKSDKAFEDYTKAINLNDKNSKALNNYATILIDKGEFKNALSSLNKALEIEPNYVDAIHNTGVCHFRLGSYNEAINVFNEVIKHKPDYAVAFYVRGLCKINTNKTREACADLNYALRLGFNAASDMINKFCR